MIQHISLGKDAETRQTITRRFIQRGIITLAGYRPGKIYGTLSCSSGKKMKMENRVFFQTEQEAITAGYRPCARCMRDKYLEWKNGLF